MVVQKVGVGWPGVEPTKRFPGDLIELHSSRGRHWYGLEGQSIMSTAR